MASFSPKLKTIFEWGRPFTYWPGERIIRAGDVPSGIYMITNGLVKSCTDTTTGNESLHAIFGREDLFPLVWMVTGKPNEANYEAITKLEVMRLPRETLLEHSLHDKEVMSTLNYNCVLLSEMYAERTATLLYPTAYERVVSLLVCWARRHGSNGNSIVTLELPITHHLIASATNIARETASRELTRLNRKNLIQREEGIISIPNINLLAAELGADF